MLMLTACGKSEFGMSENTAKHMTITAENAARDSFFMVGSLEADNGEMIAIKANLTKGSVRVEIVGVPAEQSIDEIPDMNGVAIMTANLRSTEEQAGTVPAGSYMLKATCLEKATGTVQIAVLPDPAAVSGRQDGERFEETILLEGMEETVRYEHVRNEALGFEMDYDYESLTRITGADRERFLSIYESEDDPWNYLEVSCSADDAESAAASVSESLSDEYELVTETRTLDRAGSCIRIEASELKGTGRMADRLQVVTVIPAADGCRIVTEHFTMESAEGFGRRFSEMLNTFSVLERNAA